MIGEVSALGCALCWATSHSLIKWLAGKFEPLRLSLLRCLSAAVLLWIIIPFSPGMEAPIQAPRTNWLFLALSAVIGMAIGDTIYIRGLRLINISLAYPITQAAMPLLTLLAAVFFLGESITWPLAFGTVLVLVGISLIVSPEKRSERRWIPAPTEKKGKGIVLMLIASVLWAVSISFLKIGLQNVNLIVANGIRMPFAVLALLVLMQFQNLPREFPRKRSGDLALAAFSGILGYGVGGTLFLQAIRYAGAGKAAVLISCGPLFGLPLSILFLKERVTVRVALGTVLVVLGITCIV